MGERFVASFGESDGSGRTCKMCHAPYGHPLSVCAVCGAGHVHVAGTGIHLAADHSIVPGTRAHALALDVARARVRGWPEGTPTRKFREWIERAPQVI